MDAFQHRFLPPEVPAAVTVLLLCTVIARALWHLYLSPLACQRIPGPAYAAISDIWYHWRALRSDRTVALQKLFEEYGPVVRIGPNRVAFLDSQAVHTLHRMFPFNKGEWFDHLTVGERENSVCTNDPVAHGRFRRWHAPAFRSQSLQRTAVILMEQMNDLVERLASDCLDGNAVDAFRLVKLHTLDMLGLALFDSKFKQIKTRQELPLHQHCYNWLFDAALRICLPNVLYQLVKMIPSRRLKKIFDADGGLWKVAAQMYDETPDTPADTGAVNVVSAGKLYRDSKTGQPADKNEVVAEVAMFLLAGVDNTAIAIMHMLYQLSILPDVYDKVRAELLAAGVDGSAVSDITTLRQLSYLNAFVTEVLRVHNSAGILIERIVNGGGATLAGFHIPAGTSVGSSSFCSGRRKDLFPNPMQIDPERWVTWKDGTWLERCDIPIENMRMACFPFNLGLRSCVGRPLAEIEILMTLAMVVNNFRMRPHESTTVDSMSPIEAVVLSPKAERCLLHFTPAV